MKRFFILSCAILLLAGCTLQGEYDFSSSRGTAPLPSEEVNTIGDFYAAGVDENGDYTGPMLLTNRAGTMQPQPTKVAFPELSVDENTSHQFPDGEGGWYPSQSHLSYYNVGIVVSGCLSLPQSDGTLDDTNPLGWSEYVFEPDDESEELLPMPANLADQLRPEDWLIYLNDDSSNKDIERILKGEYEISANNTLPAPENIYVRITLESYSVKSPMDWIRGGGIFRATASKIELMDTVALRNPDGGERRVLRTADLTEFTGMDTMWSSYILLWSRGAENESGLDTLTQVEVGLAGPLLEIKGELVGWNRKEDTSYMIFRPDEDTGKIFPQLDVSGEMSREIRLPDKDGYWSGWQMSEEQPIHCTVELEDFTIQWSEGSPQIYYGVIKRIYTFDTFSTVPLTSADRTLMPAEVQVGDEILGLKVVNLNRTRCTRHIPGYAAGNITNVLDVAFEGELTLTGTIDTMEMCESDAKDILLVPDAASMAMLPMPVENSEQMKIYLISLPDDIPVYSTVSITLKNYHCGLGYGVFGEQGQAEVVSVRVLPDSTISES